MNFYIDGLPVAQPRAKATIRGKHAGVYTPKTADAWKACVILAYRRHAGEKIAEGAIRLRLTFDMPRPKSHFGTGKKAAELKPNAPRWHAQKPDSDNLGKSVMDALSAAGAWTDDAQVAELIISKRWCLLGGCCATIERIE